MTTASTEHELAGIDVTRDDLDKAYAAFGKPTRRDTHDDLCSDHRGAFTLAHVEWNLGDVSVAVVSRVAVDHDLPEEVVAIRVSGRGLGYQTGAGLRLGDSLAEAIARYGPPDSMEQPSFRLADGGRISLQVREGQVAEIQVMSPWLAGGIEAVEQGDEADER